MLQKVVQCINCKQLFKERGRNLEKKSYLTSTSFDSKFKDLPPISTLLLLNVVIEYIKHTVYVYLKLNARIIYNYIVFKHLIYRILCILNTQLMSFPTDLLKIPIERGDRS